MSGTRVERRGRTGRSAVVAGLVATVAFGGLWALLAAVRPGTTFHLAPAVLAVAYPWLRWLDERPPTVGQALGAVAVGALLATAETLALAAAGWLEGPALVGGSGLAESLLAVAVGAAIAVVVSLRRSRPT